MLGFALGFLLAMITEFPDVQALLDHDRVVLIFSSDAYDPRVARQKQELDAHKADAADRDLKLFVVAENSKEAPELKRRFEVPEDNPFFVVLIGKDGTRKLGKPHPVRAEKLFRLIDSMPMRKVEMRDRR